MADMYQVTAEAVLATVDTATGKVKALLYKGAMLSGDAPELKHLLDSNMVAKVGADVSTGLNAEGGLGPAERPTVGPDSVVAAAPLTPEQEETNRRQADAKSQLPADGSAPDGRASDAVWVEYAVARGMDRDEATKAGKAEIRKALANQK